MGIAWLFLLFLSVAVMVTPPASATTGGSPTSLSPSAHPAMPAAVHPTGVAGHPASGTSGGSVAGTDTFLARPAAGPRTGLAPHTTPSASCTTESNQEVLCSVGVGSWGILNDCGTVAPSNICPGDLQGFYDDSNEVSGAGQNLPFPYAIGIADACSTGENNGNLGYANDLSIFANMMEIDRAQGGSWNSQLMIVAPAGDNGVSDCTSGNPSNGNDWYFETNLDLQMAHLFDPAAPIVLCLTADTVVQNCDDYLVQNSPFFFGGTSFYPLATISNSFGVNGPLSTYHYSASGAPPGCFPGEQKISNGQYPSQGYDHQTWERAASLGITMLTASGDGNLISTPSIDPCGISVGGTTINFDPVNGWTTGGVWCYNTGVPGCTGGGTDSVDSQPPWQAGLPPIPSGDRASADVSADAGIGAEVIDNGASAYWGGTSAATPMWAGGLTLIAEQTNFPSYYINYPGSYYNNYNHPVFSNGYMPQQGLYGMMNVPGLAYGSYFRDITTGPCTNAGCPGSGYDLPSGIGEPDFGRLEPGFLLPSATSVLAPIPLIPVVGGGYYLDVQWSGGSGGVTVDTSHSITPLGNSPQPCPSGYTWYGSETDGSPPNGEEKLTCISNPETAAGTYLGDIVLDTAAGLRWDTGYSTALNPNNQDGYEFYVMGTPTASMSTADVGQSVTFTAVPGIDLPNYQFSWTLSGVLASASCDSTTARVIHCTMTQSGAGSAKVSVCQTVGISCIGGVTTPPVGITVNAALVPGHVSPASPGIDYSETRTLSSSGPSGGTTPYSYVWYGSSTNMGSCTSGTQVSTSSTYQITADSSTEYYCYQVTDAVGGTGVSQWDLVTVNPDLFAAAPTPTSPKLDPGQSVTLTANPQPGTPLYSYEWFVSAAGGEPCSQGIPIANSNSVTYVAQASQGTESYCYVVTDSSQGDNGPESTGSVWDLVTVAAIPLAPSTSPTSASATIDVGQSDLITANPAGGSPPYTFQWYSSTTGSGSCGSGTLVSGATSSTYSASPSSTTYFCYQVTDSSSADQGRETQGSTWVLVTVYSDPVVTTPTASPGSGLIDVGQTTAIVTSASGGYGGYGYAWSGLPAGCSSSSSATISCTPTAAGTFSITVTVTDSNGYSVTSAALPYVVDTDPTVTAPVIVPNPVLAGQPISLSVTAGGGSGGYGYAWNGLPAGCSSVSAASISCSPSTGGTYAISVSVTDSNGFTVTGGSTTLVVFVEEASFFGNITGTKSGSVSLTIYQGGSRVASTSVTRDPGQPDMMAILGISFEACLPYTAVLSYSPPSKGTGDNPFVLNITFWGAKSGTYGLSHDFNAQHSATWTLTLDLASIFGEVCGDVKGGKGPAPPSGSPPPPSGAPPTTLSTPSSFPASGAERNAVAAIGGGGPVGLLALAAAGLVGLLGRSRWVGEPPAGRVQGPRSLAKTGP